MAALRLLERSRRRASPRRPEPVKQAVIDIGSNSVRIVIYTVCGAAIIQHYNEKVMAGLGRDMGGTGRLHPEGVEQAMAALGRFVSIARGIGDVPVKAFATAAVRTAADGEGFIRRIKSETGLDVAVLTGEEEARGSAVGVLAGMRDVNGVIGDLGGSSLELIVADEGALQGGETHLLGPLAVGSGAEFDANKVRRLAREAFAKSSALKAGFKTLYAVGGSWRAFASVHMETHHYPLRLLQGYRIRAKEVGRLARKMASGDAHVRAVMQDVSEKRAPLLPAAAVVLDELVKAGKFETVVVSAFGLREGLVMADRKRPREGQALLHGLEVISRMEPRQIAFCDAMHDFIRPVTDTLEPVFGSAECDALMVHAATRIADIGASLHPDYRPNLAYQMVLHGPFSETDHAERAFLALSAATRYVRTFKVPAADAALLTEDQAKRARLIGALMRAGAVYSGRAANVLEGAALVLEPGAIVLRVSADNRAMVSETVMRRLGHAARALGVEPRVDVDL